MKTVLGTLAATTLFVCQPAAADLYLNIQGIKGESVVKGYEGSMEVNSFQWSAQLETPGPGQFDWMLSDASFTQTLDSSFIYLFQTLSDGGLLGDATVYATRPSGGTPINYFQAIFRNNQLTGLALSTGGDLPFVSYAFGMDTVTLRYRGQNPQTGALGQWVEGTFTRGAGGAASFSGDPTVFQGLAEAVTAVPEPSAWAMMLAGALLTGLVARRRLPA
jgi:type VI secretion system secreted protein Hcp